MVDEDADPNDVEAAEAFAATAQRLRPNDPTATPDAVRTPRPVPESFRRSEAFLAGQIARAVARGQRVL